MTCINIDTDQDKEDIKGDSSDGNWKNNLDAEVADGFRGMTLCDADCKQIAAKVANLLLEKELYHVEVGEEGSFMKIIKGLKETNKNYLCMCYVTYGHTDKTLKSLQSHASGKFGVLKKLHGNR